MEPIPRGHYSDEERALIAGYLLHMRSGAAQAQTSVSTPPSGSTEGWAEGNQRYWTDALRAIDWLLYWIGYRPDGSEIIPWPTRRQGRSAG